MLFSAAEVRFGKTAYSHVLTKKGGATESGNDDVNQNSQITFHFPGDQLPGGGGANFVVVGGTSPSAGDYSLKYVKESGGVAVKIGAGGGQFDHLGTLGKKPGKKP